MVTATILARAIAEHEPVGDGDNAAEVEYHRRLDAALDYAAFVADQAAMADEEFAACVRLHEEGGESPC